MKILRITISDELAARVERAVEAVRGPALREGIEPPTMAEVIASALEQGLISSECSRGDLLGDARPVSSLTLRELLQATGIADAAEARSSAIEAARVQREAVQAALSNLGDARALMLSFPNRVRSRDDLETAIGRLRALWGSTPPGVGMAISYALVDDAAAVSQPASKTPPAGVN